MSIDAVASHLPKIWPSRIFYGWAIVYASFFISIAQVPMYGPVFSVFVKPIEDEFGWSRSTITIAFTIGSIGGSILSALIGVILDRYGARLVTVFAGVAVAVSLFCVAIMTEPWHFWISYGVARSAALAGVSLGTSVAIANWFIRNRGRATAIRAMGQRGGQALMPLLIMPILVLLGWRESFAVFSVVALLLITLPAFFFIRRRPEDYGLKPDGVELDIEGEAPQTDEFSWSLKQVRKTRALWMITIGMSAGIAAQIAINVHAVANFQDLGMAESLSITVASLFTGIAALSMVGWGLLLDRMHVRYVSMISMVLFIISMSILLLAGSSFYMAFIFAIIFGLATGGWTVSQMVMIPNYFGRMHAGSIKGFISPIEGTVGISGPLIAAFIFDEYGSYDLAFYGAIGAFTIGLISFYFAKPLDSSKTVRVMPS